MNSLVDYLPSKISIVVSTLNLRHDKFLKSNAHNTNYEYAAPPDRAFRSHNDMPNLDLLFNFLPSVINRH